MANWSLPTVTSAYTDVIQFIKDREVDVARWFSTAFSAGTNIPDGCVRWNNTNKNWEIYSTATSTWSALAAKYGIDVETVDGAHAGVAANNVLKLDSNAFVPLGNIPSTLTGKSADQLDGYHASTGTTGNSIPVRDGSGVIPGDIAGNAAYAPSAGNADTLDNYHADTGTTINTVPVRNASGAVPGNITGNAATASKLATPRTINGVSFDGSADITISATATSHTHPGGDITSAVANATNGRNVYDNGAFGGTTGYKEATAVKVGFAQESSNADTVDGEHASNFATHRAEGRNYIDNARMVYDNGGGGGTVGWKEASSVKVVNASYADTFPPVTSGNLLQYTASSTGNVVGFQPYIAFQPYSSVKLTSGAGSEGDSTTYVKVLEFITPLSGTLHSSFQLESGWAKIYINGVAVTAEVTASATPRTHTITVNKDDKIQIYTRSDFNKEYTLVRNWTLRSSTSGFIPLRFTGFRTRNYVGSDSAGAALFGIVESFA
jgi:hypothetical protein